MMGCCGWGWGIAGNGLGLVGWLLNLVLTLLVLGGVIWLVVWLVRRLSSAGSTWLSHEAAGGPEDPKRVLQLRYARGEITREQYLAMLKDLEEGA